VKSASRLEAGRYADGADVFEARWVIAYAASVSDETDELSDTREEEAFGEFDAPTDVGESRENGSES